MLVLERILFYWILTEDDFWKSLKFKQAWKVHDWVKLCVVIFSQINTRYCLFSVKLTQKIYVDLRNSYIDPSLIETDWWVL